VHAFQLHSAATSPPRSMVIGRAETGHGISCSGGQLGRDGPTRPDNGLVSS
jgi:hypothetical protein